jgi:hypothetical protein
MSNCSHNYSNIQNYKQEIMLYKLYTNYFFAFFEIYFKINELNIARESVFCNLSIPFINPCIWANRLVDTFIILACFKFFTS